MDLKTSLVCRISGVAVPVTAYGHTDRVGDTEVVVLDSVVDWMGDRINPKLFDDHGDQIETALYGAFTEEWYGHLEGK